MCQVHNVNINCSIIYCSLWCMVVDKAYNCITVFPQRHIDVKLVSGTIKTVFHKTHFA